MKFATANCSFFLDKQFIIFQCLKYEDNYWKWSSFFSNIMPCSSVQVTWYIWGTYHLCFWGRRISYARNQHEGGSKQSCILYIGWLWIDCMALCPIRKNSCLYGLFWWNITYIIIFVHSFITVGETVTY